MPRTGWLAAGTLAAAFILTSLDRPLPSPALLLAGGGLVLTAGLLGLDGPAPRRPASLVVLGAGLVLVRLSLGAPSTAPPLPDGRGPWIGVVESLGSPRLGRQRVTIGLEPGGARVLVALPPEPHLEPGDRIEFDASLRPPPDGPYGDYLRRSGLAGSATAGRHSRLGRVGPALLRFDEARSAAADALSRAIPEPEAGLAAGILVGLRDRVDREVAADFTTAGLSHIVAISGWNIAIVGAAVAACTRRLGRRRRAWLTVGAVVGYVAFVGPSASVVRAATMALVILIAGLSGRSARAAAALGAAVTVLVLVEPSWATEPGFQLSVAATAGLVRWATPWSERLRAATGHRLPTWLTETLAVSLAAQAATLPIVVASFGRISLVAPLANLIVVPLVPIAMGLAAVAALGGLLGLFAGPVLAALIGLPATLILRLIVTAAHVTAGLPLASLAVAEPIDDIIALSSASALVLLAWQGGRRESVTHRTTRAGPAIPPLPRERVGLQTGTGESGQTGPRPPRERGRRSQRPPRRLGPLRLVAVLGAATVVAGILVAAYRPDGDPRVTILDVGQGDAILVEGGRGARLLVDAGPDPGRLLRLLDGRLPPWDRRIDVVVVSHPHEDHLGGLPNLLVRYRVGQIMTTGMAGLGPAAQTLADRLTGDRRVVVGAAGDRLRIDGVELVALWPVRGSVPSVAPDSNSAVNDTSLVFLGTARGRRFLLTGDVEEGVDPQLVARGLPSVELLKVAHHGSRTATTREFLAAVRPRLAVISVGADNSYGHPAPETIARLKEVGAAVLRTDEVGSVEVVFRAEATEAHSAAGLLRIRAGSRADGSPTGAFRGSEAGGTGPWVDPEIGGRRDDGSGPRFSTAGVANDQPLAPHRPPTAIEYDRPDAPDRADRTHDEPFVATLPPTAAPGGGLRRVGRRRRSSGSRGRWLPTPVAGPRRAFERGGQPRAADAERRLSRRHGRRPRCRPPPRRLPRLARTGRRAPAGRKPTMTDPRASRSRDGGSSPPRPLVPLGHYTGDDDYALDEAATALARRVAGSGPPLDRWRISGRETSLEEVLARLGSAPLFGGGTIAILTQAEVLIGSRSPDQRVARIDRLLDGVAPGNALAILDLREPGLRPSATIEALRTAVAERGGEVRELRTPTEGKMTAWLLEQARERGIRLEPAAAAELAARVGAFVREGDIDRRGMARLASSELDKLGHYRGAEPFRVEDVRALVAEAIPTSTWAALDAVGERRLRGTATRPGALDLLDRLLETTPPPLLIGVLHRRLRELLEVASLVAAGTPSTTLARQLRLKPYRAQKLVEQAARWTVPDLEAALEGLLALDLRFKNVPPATEGQLRLALALWLLDRVGPRPGPEAEIRRAVGQTTAVGAASSDRPRR